MWLTFNEHLGIRLKCLLSFSPAIIYLHNVALRIATVTVYTEIFFFLLLNRCCVVFVGNYQIIIIAIIIMLLHSWLVF